MNAKSSGEKNDINKFIWKIIYIIPFNRLVLYLSLFNICTTDFRNDTNRKLKQLEDTYELQSRILTNAKPKYFLRVTFVSY